MWIIHVQGRLISSILLPVPPPPPLLHSLVAGQSSHTHQHLASTSSAACLDQSKGNAHLGLQYIAVP